MMMNFFSWNNGRLIINVDLITHIEVTTRVIDSYAVYFDGGTCKEIDKECYQALVKFIMSDE